MTDRDALLAAITANPDDDTPRLVYADWLQENGDEERAEFIRVQCRVAVKAARPNVRRWLPLVQRRAADWFPGLPASALRVSESSWVRDLDRPESYEGLVRALVRRGFIEGVACPLPHFESAAKELFGRHPIREVVLTDRTAGQYAGSRSGGFPPGKFVWASTELLSLGFPHVLPGNLFAYFEQLELGKPHPETPTRWFETDAAADAALSAACVALGRKRAKLRPPPQGN